MKKLSLAGLALAVSAFVAGPASAAKEMIFASTAPNTGINKVFHETFAKSIAENGGLFDVEFFVDGKLGGEKELIEMLRLGETHIHTGVIHSALYYPELDATLIPYLFPDYASIERYLAGPIGDRMNAALAEKGNAVFLGTHYQGPRWTTSNKRFDTIEGLRGIKIRMPEIPLWIRVWGELGAVVSPIPSPEVYSALQTGVIDAQENMISNIWGRKLHEAQKYLINTAHQQSYTTIMAQKKWWDGLTDAERQAIQKAVDTASAAASAAADAEIKEIAQRLQDAGLELVEPKPEFRAEAMPIVRAIAQDVLAPGVLDGALAAIGQN